jgi:hypothetical protein
MRGDTTTRWHVKKAVAHQEVAAQQEATQQPTRQMGGNGALVGGGIGDGVGVTVATVGLTTIN